MKVEHLNPEYFRQVVRIHEKHFRNEFPLENILDSKILNQLVIVDNDDNVITFGGIKLLFELFLVTDLDRSPRDRVLALKTFLNKAITEARRKEFEQVHCFPSEIGDWVEILGKVGFSQTKGRALYMNL